jgi:hypothetical protein
MKTQLTPSEILKAVIQQLNTDTSKFSREIGNERPDNIYKILEGKTNPNWDTLIRIATRFEEISADFLLRGKGEVITNKGVLDSQIGDGNNYQKNISDSKLVGTVNAQVNSPANIEDLVIKEKDKIIEILKNENEFLKSLIPKPPHQ